MTNTPGNESPGSSSDSPEPDDGQNRWSAQQPPPVQGWARWGPPSGPQHPQNAGPRWGDGAPPPPPPAWQQNSWDRPPAPKPGVIPLRPLGLGEILDGAIATLRRHWRAILGATFVISLVTEGLSVVVQGVFLDDTRIQSLRDNQDPSVGDILHSLGGTTAVSGLSGLVTAVGTLLAMALIAVVTSRSVLGRTVTAREVLADLRPRLPKLIGMTGLVLLALCGVLGVSALPGALIALAGAETGGFALMSLGLLGGMVTVVWLWIQWSLAASALVLEKQEPMAALKRSAKLVRGTWWRVLGIQLVAVLLAAIVGVIIEMPFSLVGSAITGDEVTSFWGSGNNVGWVFLVISGAGQVLASTVTLPVTAGVASLLYMDQRIRRESLDIDLVRAAQEPANSAG